MKKVTHYATLSVNARPFALNPGLLLLTLILSLIPFYSQAQITPNATGYLSITDGNSYMSTALGPNGEFCAAWKHDDTLNVGTWNGSSWDTELILSTSLVNSSTSLSDNVDLVVDSAGVFHMACRWGTINGGSPGARGVLYVRYDGNWTYSIVESFTHPNGFLGCRNPSIALSPSGNPEMVYEHTNAETGTGYQRFHHAVWNGSGWTITQHQNTIRSSHYDIAYPKLKIDANGKRHVSYMKNNQGNDHDDLWYGTDKSGSWVFTLVNAGTATLDNAEPNDLILDSNGNPYIANDEDGATVQDILIYANTGSGFSAIDPQVTVDGAYPSISVNSNDHMALLYQINNSNTLMVTHNTGSGWNNDTLVGPLDGRPGSKMDITINETDQILVLYHDKVTDEDRRTYYFIGTLPGGSTPPPSPSNNAPVFANNTLSIDENSSNNTVVGAFGATDADTDPLTYTILSGNTGSAFKVSGGNLAVNNSGQLDYENTSSYSLQVKVSDGTDSATATITVNVNDVNEAPVLTNGTMNIDEDEASRPASYIWFNMYSDAEQDTIRAFKILSLPTAGHLEINGSANVTIGTEYTVMELVGLQYIPNADTSGTDSFALNVSDGQLYASAPATLTINILPVNDPPVIRDVQSVHQEDVTDHMLTGFTLADYSDVEGDTITWVQVVTLPSHGTLRQNGNPINAGDVIGFPALYNATYTPDANYFGQDNFVYNMSDGTDYAAQTASINIIVTPVSDAPTNISLSDTAINENEANGTVIGTLSATDIDPADSHTFQVNNGAFSIIGNQLVSNAVFNHEIQNVYTIDITAMDQAGETYTKTFTIAINDQNDAPTGITLSNNTISESTTINSMVGILTAADEDAMYTHTYSLVSGNGDDDNNAFVINNNILQTNTTFSYNNQQAYSIRVRVTDDQNGTYEEVFVINITDQNTAPTDLTLSANTVLENESAGTIVGSISATDADQAETFTYTLVSGAGDADNGSFSIVNDELHTAASFDFETKSSYSIRVKVEDGSANTYEEAFTIQIQDVNETPTQVTISNNTVAENLPAGTLVGTLSTTDVDANDTHTYVLSSGNGATGNASFAINGDQLVTSTVLDFETQDTYTVKVKSTDAAGNYIEQQFTINVADANDAPTGVTLDVLTIDENSPMGATVGTLSATDLDPASSHTFTLVSGVGSADNASFTIVNNKLQVNAGYDFETKSSYRVRVRATDQGNAWTEETFTITINDVNETPDAVNAQTVTINENLPAGTVVATLSTVDVDNGDSHSYDLAAGIGDADNGLFAINGNQVVTIGALNYESQSVYSIRVEATDQGGLKKATVVAINITDANDAPVAANMHKSVNRNNSLSFFSRELLNSWSDEDGDAMVTVRIQHVPAYGKLYNKTQLLADGDVISVADITVLKYVPNNNFAGNDSFTYQVSDGTDYGNVATVNITVNMGRVAGPSVSNVGHHNFSGFVNNRLASETGIEEVSAENATLGNYPNPFYGSTKIAYTLPAEFTVNIKVYDLLGKEVQLLVNDIQSAGDHAITWNGTDMNGQQLTSGKYICQMVITDVSGETVSVKTISLMKVK